MARTTPSKKASSKKTPSTRAKPRKRAATIKASSKKVAKPKTKRTSTKKANPKQTSPKETRSKQQKLEKGTVSSIKDKALNLSARTLWSKTAELVSLEFTLRPHNNCELYPQYAIGLHAWLLQQIQSFDADLSAYMHDGQSEKAFSISGLDGQFVSHRQSLRLQANETYLWRVNALSKDVSHALITLLRQLPEDIEIKNAPLAIESVRLAQPATTYTKLLKAAEEDSGSVSLSFISPTSFRRKKQHMPLPWPKNVFHSYLRRWNHFSRKVVDLDEFLDWLDNHIVIQRHQMASVKVAAAKQGSVTGFTGAITYALTRQAANNPDFQALFYALVQLAPYCGTGHKTTFGLGETQLGWRGGETFAEVPALQQMLAGRIETLTALFLSQKKRQGGDRAIDTAQKWATILARREQGDSLAAIAADMDLAYETTKTYSKLARRALRTTEE